MLEVESVSGAFVCEIALLIFRILLMVVCCGSTGDKLQFMMKSFAFMDGGIGSCAGWYPGSVLPVLS